MDETVLHIEFAGKIWPGITEPDSLLIVTQEAEDDFDAEFGEDTPEPNAGASV